MQPLSFAIIGSGWRSMFFVRIARSYPQYFRLLSMLCRNEQKATELREEYGIPTTTSEAECEAAHPDFVVVAVQRDAIFSVTKQWLQKGFPVLAETPAAGTEEELEELWTLHKNGACLQIAEQYLRYPLLAAGLRAVRQGLLGDPYAVTLSLAHDYHAASLIRHMLNMGLDRQGETWHLPAVKLLGSKYVFPVEETDSRSGPITDGHLSQRTRCRVTLEFEGGKTAFYDFDGVQYHSLIRARHVSVQGPRGEWYDTVLRYTDEDHHPVHEKLRPALLPEYGALRNGKLLALSGSWQPAVHMENWQDEYAIATMMLDMRELIATGNGGYPLAEALEDTYTAMLMERALSNPGQVVESQPHSWQNGD